MSIISDLHELVDAKVISSETAQQIVGYYKKKQERLPTAKNRQLLFFGVVGSCLVGIGLLFIIANQWDELPRSVKTICAFLLLIIPQLLCFYAMVKKAGNVVWRESTALILFFAVGASISLVSQIYHINGETTTFILTWMLLSAPMIYLLDSSAVSIAYLFGIMFYGFALKGDASSGWNEHVWWLLYTIPMPRYLLLCRKSNESQLHILHHWIIPLVLFLTLSTFGQTAWELMPPLCFTLFGIFYQIGKLSYFSTSAPERNGYSFIGQAGTFIGLYVMSFNSNWEKLLAKHFDFNLLILTPEFIANVLLFAVAILLLYRRLRKTNLADLKWIEVVWLSFILLFVIGCYTSLVVYLINLGILLIGLHLAREGSRKDHLGQLNAGMFAITFLLLCRSFDIDLSLFVKGLLFVVVGIGFFLANWWMLKKRKENEA